MTQYKTYIYYKIIIRLKKGKKMVDKRANFIKLAEIRVNNLINAIRLVKNLSNKNNYSYDPDQVNRILKVIKDDVRELEQEFKSGGKSKEEFKL